MKTLHIRLPYRDGDTTAWFEGYVFHVYFNHSARTVKILNAGLEEDEFSDVMSLTIDDGTSRYAPIGSLPTGMPTDYAA